MALRSVTALPRRCVGHMTPVFATSASSNFAAAGRCAGRARSFATEVQFPPVTTLSDEEQGIKDAGACCRRRRRKN
jgi:hypothetical protein